MSWITGINQKVLLPLQTNKKKKREFFFCESPCAYMGQKHMVLAQPENLKM